MRNKILSLFVAALSAGWLLPMYWGVSIYLQFWRLEAWPTLIGQHPGNSFPFLSAAGDCFFWAFLWLAVVVVFWAYLGCSALLRSRERA